jgi:hypothetical protein
MFQQTFSHFWRTKQTLAVGILATCCALAFAPAEYGQTDQGKGDDRKPLTDNSATVQPVVPPTSTGEATIYVYRQKHFLGAVDNALIYINGNLMAVLHNSNYIQARVPQGKAFIISYVSVPSTHFEVIDTRFGADTRFYDFIRMKIPSPPYTGLLTTIPGCAALDWRQLWVSEGLSESQREDATLCEDMLRKAVAAITTDFRSRSPSAENIHLCNLHYYQVGDMYTGSGAFEIITRPGYSLNEEGPCQDELNLDLKVLTEHTKLGSRIAIKAEAGKTYYIRLHLTYHYKTADIADIEMELVDEATGFKEISNLHLGNL